MSKIKLQIIATEYDFQILDIFLTNDGLIKPELLRELKLPSNIDFTKGIIINGRGPIWLYAHLIHELHIAAYVATFDPRIGAVVVQSHKADTYKLGDIIPVEIILKYLSPVNFGNGVNQKSKIIAFIGPPHSGKSVLLRLLWDKIYETADKEFSQRHFFIVRACPDGEGLWSDESEQDIVKIIRYKGEFNQEFVDKVKQNIIKLKQSKRLLFIDCGGKIDKYNQEILNECSDVIIVSKSEEEILEWVGAAKTCNLNIIAIVNSTLDNRSEILEEEPLKLIIGPLVRGSAKELDSKAIIPEILLNKILKIYAIES